MLTIRRAEDRGHADHGWLSSHHTFSFADYHDEQHMGFGPLRVINDDTVAPGKGFPQHAHRDMEILSYVLEGALEHADSMGTSSVIRPGDVQRMSAGSGVLHSEFNASPTEPVHFLQIWILPSHPGLPFGYEQKSFSEDEKRGRLRLVASQDGADGSLRIQQEVRMFAAVLERGHSVAHDLSRARSAWVHIARGAAEINGLRLRAGDGLAISTEDRLVISSSNEATKNELLLFDFPP